MFFYKGVHTLRRAVDDSLDISVPCIPGAPQKPFGIEFVAPREVVPQPIQSFAQRTPPLLVPVSVNIGITTAVALPALHAMRATPRCLLQNFDFMGRRMGREVLSIISDPRQLVAL